MARGFYFHFDCQWLTAARRYAYRGANGGAASSPCVNLAYRGAVAFRTYARFPGWVTVRLPLPAAAVSMSLIS